jgi:hypothetical protein
MASNSDVVPTPVSGAFSRIVIVIQFAKDVPDAFTYRPASPIVMCQTFEAGRPAFADLSAIAKMNCFPSRKSYTKRCFNHVQNNIFWYYYWGLDLSNRGIDSSDLPGYV